MMQHDCSLASLMASARRGQYTDAYHYFMMEAILRTPRPYRLILTVDSLDPRTLLSKAFDWDEDRDWLHVSNRPHSNVRLAMGNFAKHRCLFQMNRYPKKSFPFDDVVHRGIFFEIPRHYKWFKPHLKHSAAHTTDRYSYHLPDWNHQTILFVQSRIRP